MTIDVVPRSPSIVLRATQIVRVRVLSSAPGPWVPVRGPLVRREVPLRVRVEEVLKGDADRAGNEPELLVEQHKLTIDWGAALPGAWSSYALEPDAEYVVFGTAHGGLTRNLVEPEQVHGSEVLPEVRLAVEAEAKPLDLQEVVGRARSIAPQLGVLFAGYLWVRHGGTALTDSAAADLVFSLLEAPDLAVPARTQLLSSAVADVNSVPRVKHEAVSRFVLAVFRLLEIPAAAPLHENVVSTYLPALVGIAGGVPRSAAEVFHERPAERAAALRALARFEGSPRAAELTAWLRTGGGGAMYR